MVSGAIPQGAQVESITRTSEGYTIRYSSGLELSSAGIGAGQNPQTFSERYTQQPNIFQRVILQNLGQKVGEEGYTPVSAQLLDQAANIDERSGAKIGEAGFMTADVGIVSIDDPKFKADPSKAEPVTTSMYAKTGLNVLAGVASWGESLIGLKTPSYQETESSKGYFLGSVLPDIALGAQFVAEAPNLVRFARIKLFGDPKEAQWERMLSKADPLTKAQLDDMVRGDRPVSAIEKRGDIFAYNDPIATANEDVVKYMRTATDKTRIYVVEGGGGGGGAKPAQDFSKVSSRVASEGGYSGEGVKVQPKFDAAAKPSGGVSAAEYGWGGTVTRMAEETHVVWNPATKYMVQAPRTISSPLGRMSGIIPAVESEAMSSRWSFDAGKAVGRVEIDASVKVDQRVPPIAPIDTVPATPQDTVTTIPDITPVPMPDPVTPLPREDTVVVPKISPDAVAVPMQTQIPRLQLQVPRTDVMLARSYVPPRTVPPPWMHQRKSEAPQQIRGFRLKYVEDVNPFNLDFIMPKGMRKWKL